MSLEGCIAGCELSQCYFYKRYVYFCDQLEVWSVSPHGESQALPQFPRTGKHLEKKDSYWKIQKYKLSPQTRRQDAHQFRNKQKHKSNRLFLSDCPSPRCFGFKQPDKRNKHPPKAPSPSPCHSDLLSKYQVVLPRADCSRDPEENSDFSTTVPNLSFREALVPFIEFHCSEQFLPASLVCPLVYYLSLRIEPPQSVSWEA